MTILVEGLKVSSSRNEDGEWIQLPKTFSKMFLPAEQNEITTPAKLKQAMKVLGRYNR